MHAILGLPHILVLVLPATIICFFVCMEVEVRALLHFSHFAHIACAHCDHMQPCSTLPVFVLDSDADCTAFVPVRHTCLPDADLSMYNMI